MPHVLDLASRAFWRVTGRRVDLTGDQALLAAPISADSLLLDDDERGPQSKTLRLKLEASDQFTPEEQEHVAAFIEGALPRRHARRVFSGQAS